MPNWNELQEEIAKAGNIHDRIRQKYLKDLHDITGRNVILYYSGWLQQEHLGHGSSLYAISESDKTGFMSALNGVDKAKGLDLILHTPGGSVSDTESLVSYLLNFFDRDIRVIVPQIAQSAGTMIALASKEIVMGRQSRLGPIDPQVGGMSAQHVVQEFHRAEEAIREDPNGRGVLWRDIVVKRYPPTFYDICQRALEWSEEIVVDWLVKGMLSDSDNADGEASAIAEELSDVTKNKAHDRPIDAEKMEELGACITNLEEDQSLQDAVLTVHHATIQTLAAYPVSKIIENHEGVTTTFGIREQD